MSSLILPNDRIDNIKMVIFDKDGTLIDVHHYWCSMIELRAQFFVDSVRHQAIDLALLHNDLVDSMGIDLKTKKMKPEGPVGIKPRSYIIDVVLHTLSKYSVYYTREKIVDIFDKVDEYSKEKLKEIVIPLDGVKKLLSDLKNANIKCAIATTDLSTRAFLAMKDLQLEEYFVAIAGADLVTKAKPNPDLVHYLLKKTNLTIDDVVVIGDSVADLYMAQNAMCKFIGVKSGLYTEEFINKSEYIVDTLPNIKVII